MAQRFCDSGGSLHQKNPETHEVDPTRICELLVSFSDVAVPGAGYNDRSGRAAGSVNEIAVELGCAWHTINEAVIQPTSNRANLTNA